MSSNADGKSSWARYIKQATERDGWNGARLARESGVNRTTVYRWGNGSGGNVTVERVRRVALALGDDPDEALRIAGDLLPTAPPPAGEDEAMDLIDRAPVDDALKDVMRRKLAELRERERQERLSYIQDMIDLARRGEG